MAEDYQERVEAAIIAVKNGMSARQATELYSVSGSTINNCIRYGSDWEERLQNAVEAVEDGMSLRQAAKLFSVAAVTISKLVQSGGRNLGSNWKERLQAAIADVEGGMSLRKAGKLYGVAPVTISKHVRGGEIAASGGRSWLSEEFESDLADYCRDLIKVGYPQVQKYLPVVVQTDLNKMNKNVFENENMPSDGWVNSFFKRFPDLAEYLAKSHGPFKVHVKYVNRKNFFKNLQKYLEAEGMEIESVFSRENAPSVYVCNEIGVLVNANVETRKIFITKSSQIANRAMYAKKSIMSTLYCASASGQFVKPLIVNKGESPIIYEVHDGLDQSSYTVGCSNSGWLTSELFYSWISDTFHRELIENNRRKPVLLLLDGNIFPVSKETLQFAKDNQILLYFFPLSSSTINPLDLGVLESLQEGYKEAYSVCWGSLAKTTMPVKHFASVYMKAFCQNCTAENAVRGFETAGLLPLDRKCIEDSSFNVFEQFNSITEKPRLQEKVLVAHPVKVEVPITQPPARNDVPVTVPPLRTDVPHNLEGAFGQGYIEGQIALARRLGNIFPEDLISMYWARNWDSDFDKKDLTYIMWQKTQSIMKCPPKSNPFFGMTEPLVGASYHIKDCGSGVQPFNADTEKPKSSKQQVLGKQALRTVDKKSKNVRKAKETYSKGKC